MWTRIGETNVTFLPGNLYPFPSEGEGTVNGVTHDLSPDSLRKIIKGHEKKGKSIFVPHASCALMGLYNHPDHTLYDVLKEFHGKIGIGNTSMIMDTVSPENTVKLVDYVDSKMHVRTVLCSEPTKVLEQNEKGSISISMKKHGVVKALSILILTSELTINEFLELQTNSSILREKNDPKSIFDINIYNQNAMIDDRNEKPTNNPGAMFKVSSGPILSYEPENGKKYLSKTLGVGVNKAQHLMNPYQKNREVSVIIVGKKGQGKSEQNQKNVIENILNEKKVI